MEQEKRWLIIFCEISEDEDETPKVEESDVFSMVKDRWYDFNDSDFNSDVAELQGSLSPYTDDAFSALIISDKVLCDVISSVLRDGYDNALYNSFKQIIKNYAKTHRRQIIKVIDRMIDAIAFIGFPALNEMTLEMLDCKAENCLYESPETKFSL